MKLTDSSVCRKHSPQTGPAMLLSLACAVLITTDLSPAETGTDDWPAYGRDPGGMRYSPLDEINRQNVPQLKVAWVFHTGDISDGSKGRQRSGFETTPILVDGMLYLT